MNVLSTTHLGLQVSWARIFYFLLRVVLFVMTLFAFFSEPLRTAVSREVLLVILVAVSTSLLMATVRLVLISTYRRRQKKTIGNQDNFILGMNALSRLLLVVVIVGSIFPIYAIPFTSFLTSLSVFSVAISWLFKEYLTNYFDSFRLMFSTDLLIGDYIKVNEDSKGIITDITLRATKVKTDEGDVVLIPNTTLMNNPVTNYSKVRFKRIIVPFTVKTLMMKDVRAFETYLTDAAYTAVPDVVDTERVFLRLLTVENGYTRCAFELAIDNYNFDIEDALKRAVLEAVIVWQQRT